MSNIGLQRSEHPARVALPLFLPRLAACQTCGLAAGRCPPRRHEPTCRGPCLRARAARAGGRTGRRPWRRRRRREDSIRGPARCGAPCTALGSGKQPRASSSPARLAPWSTRCCGPSAEIVRRRSLPCNRPATAMSNPPPYRTNSICLWPAEHPPGLPGISPLFDPLFPLWRGSRGDGPWMDSDGPRCGGVGAHRRRRIRVVGGARREASPSMLATTGTAPLCAYRPNRTASILIWAPTAPPNPSHGFRVPDPSHRDRSMTPVTRLPAGRDSAAGRAESEGRALHAARTAEEVWSYAKVFVAPVRCPWSAQCKGLGSCSAVVLRSSESDRSSAHSRALHAGSPMDVGQGTMSTVLVRRRASVCWMGFKPLLTRKGRSDSDPLIQT